MIWFSNNLLHNITLIKDYVRKRNPALPSLLEMVNMNMPALRTVTYCKRLQSLLKRKLQKPRCYGEFVMTKLSNKSLKTSELYSLQNVVTKKYFTFTKSQIRFIKLKESIKISTRG